MKNRIISLIMVVFMVIGILPIDLIEASSDSKNSEYIKAWIDYVKFSGDHNESAPVIPKTDNQEGVIINPVIQIKLKGKLSKNGLNKNSIKLTSNDGDSFVINTNDIWLSQDEYGADLLKIDLNSLNRKGQYPLRKDTLYKLVLKSGALRFEDFKVDGKNTNGEIEIHFLTGSQSVKGKEGLNPVMYSSDKQGNDDITTLSGTKLGLDEDRENIYVHMNEEIKWNTEKLSNSNVDNTLNEEDLKKYFKLYKLPNAYKKDQLYTEFRYNEQRNVQVTGNNKGMQEVGIKSIGIVLGDEGDKKIIKITPKESLIPYNMYYLKLENQDLIKDIYGRELEENIDKYIWTASDDKSKIPKWKKDEISGNKITAEEIINNSNSPDNKSLAYNLYGVPKYNEHIEDNKGKPIIINVEGEVIPNPEIDYKKGRPNIYTSSIYVEDVLKNIELIEEYKDEKSNEVTIKWYKLKYDSKSDNTEISIYPKGELDSGKKYQLTIDADTLATRSGNPLEKLELNFTIEGDKTKKRGIYTIESPGQLSVNDPRTEVTFNIKGFNFTEDVKRIRLKNVVTGKEIIINDSYNSKFKFINVDELELTLRGDSLKELLKEGNGGRYKIYIDFKSGNPAELVDEEDNYLIIYERPNVLETNPEKDNWSFDKRNLYKSFPNGKSGNYITVIFDNIKGELREGGNITTSSFGIYSDKESSNNLIDTERSVEYEGFSTTDGLMDYKIEVSGEKRENIDAPYGTAKLYINDDKYKVGDEIKITLFDHDLNSNSNSREETTVSVTIGNGDPKDVTLTETDRNSGKFEGEIKAWASSETEKDSDVIEVKYEKRQSGDGTIYKQIIQKAKIVNKVDYKREAQVYIEKELYKKNEEVKITVVDKYANKNTNTEDTVKVKVSFPDDNDINISDIELTETGVNTGVFEAESSLKNFTGEFNITYTYTEKVTGGTSGKAKIYIPITDDIQDDTIYIAKLPEGLVYYDLEDPDETGKWKSQSYEWSFKTSDGPMEFNMDKDFKGSAPEGYGNKHEVILEGENFSDDVRVYFIDVSGEEYKAVVSEVTSSSKDNDQLLHVYLPTGRNRLKPGLYDILVENEGATPQEIKYGVYSIVPGGNYVPDEEHRVKDAIIDKEKDKEKIRDGLKEIIKTSKNELELSSKYTSQTLDLDFILGEEVLIHEIKYDGNSISTLNTTSKWSDIKLIGLRRDYSREPMIIRLGRTEPSVRDSIKKKLIGDSIKSDFIQISGTNYELGSAELSIPYKESNGENLKVLRYDEDTRRIDKNISFRVNKNDKRVEITNAKKGIYVIVE